MGTITIEDIEEIIGAITSKNWNVLNERLDVLNAKMESFSQASDQRISDPVEKKIFSIKSDMKLEPALLSINGKEEGLFYGYLPPLEMIDCFSKLKILTQNAKIDKSKVVLDTLIEEAIITVIKIKKYDFAKILIERLKPKITKAIVDSFDDVTHFMGAGDLEKIFKEKLELMLALGIVPLSNMAATVPFGELEAKALEYRIQNTQGLQYLKETQDRTVLAHTWGIGGNSEMGGIQFELNGSQPRLMRYELKKIVKHMQTDKENIAVLKQKLQTLALPLDENQIELILDQSNQAILNMDPHQDMLKQYAAMKPVFIQVKASTSTGGNHGVGCAIWGNTCFYINRGATEGEITQGNTGVSIYQFENEDDMKGLITLSKNGVPSLKAVEVFLEKKGKILDKINMKPQSSGNCGWATCKGLYMGAVYLHTLKALENVALSEIERQDMAKRFSYLVYKNLSTQKRIFDIHKYLKNKDSMPKDLNLIQKVYAKVQKPVWQQRGTAAILPAFDQSLKSQFKYTVQDFKEAAKRCDLEQFKFLSQETAFLNPKLDLSDVYLDVIFSYAIAIKDKNLQNIDNSMDFLKLLIANTPINKGTEKNICFALYVNRNVLSKAQIDKVVTLLPQNNIESLVRMLSSPNSVLFESLLNRSVDAHVLNDDANLLCKALSALDSNKDWEEQLKNIKLIVERGITDVQYMHENKLIVLEPSVYLSTIAKVKNLSPDKVDAVRAIFPEPSSPGCTIQ